MSDSPLMQAATIRERSKAITRWVEAGRSDHWTIERECLELTAEEVASITRKRFPDLKVPCHSRWRHFEAGGEDRGEDLTAALAQSGCNPNGMDALLARVDLAVVSVLLDAGAGAHWRFTDPRGRSFARSEGLAIATIEAFMRGVFSADAGMPLRVDARALEQFDQGALARVFQLAASNPLDGIEGRLTLLNRLGRALRERGLTRPAELYLTLLNTAGETSGKPGSALRAEDAASGQAGRTGPRVSAAALLHATVTGLAQVWLQAGEAPDGSRGDLWPHPAARDAEATHSPETQGWVPFHKLSQWLCYSLLEPLIWAGFELTDPETFTALPEYRNGGLLVDTGVLRLRDPAHARRVHGPGDPLVIEWRAMTLSLIDELAVRVRAKLDCDARALPLASLLEGGTWAAGRGLAQRLRDGRPPLEVDTAGSVF
jgi:hypothetical protein